jgi:hypothetical protein
MSSDGTAGDNEPSLKVPSPACRRRERRRLLTGDLQDPGVEQAMVDDVDDVDQPAVAVAPPSVVDELRERLIARGLLVDAPAVVIPREPRPELAVPEVDPLAVLDEAEPHWAESPFDAWDVEPSDETIVVPCPRCRVGLHVAVQGTRVACADCDLAWRYAVCDRCDALHLTVERQESWPCPSCGAFVRSWWRTPTAPQLALPILARRRHAIVQEQRRIAREGMRMRRWKLIAFAVVAALLASGIVVAGRAAEPEQQRGVDVACTHFRALLEEVAAGRMPPAQLEQELEQLQVEAEGTSPELTTAVAGMLAADSATAPAFISARASFIDACGTAFPRS